MRSAASVWLAVMLLVAACSGGYPLEPTRCDEWCNATQGMACGYYEPASCVSQCEAQQLSNELCRTQLDAVLACFRSTPGAAAAQCSFYGVGGERPCQAESEGLGLCAGGLFQNYDGAPIRD